MLAPSLQHCLVCHFQSCLDLEAMGDHFLTRWKIKDSVANSLKNPVWWMFGFDLKKLSFITLGLNLQIFSCYCRLIWLPYLCLDLLDLSFIADLKNLCEIEVFNQLMYFSCQFTFVDRLLHHSFVGLKECLIELAHLTRISIFIFCHIRPLWQTCQQFCQVWVI